MHRRHTLRWILCGLLLAMAALAPLTVGADGRISVAAACADGTCCPETGSDCIINNILTENAYRKTGPGSCNNPGQPAPPP